jgi:hypothetical protein
MVRPTLLNFHLIFSWAVMKFKSTVAYCTFPEKVMGPAISNQSKSELRGTCVLFFPFLFHGKDVGWLAPKEKIKKLRNV